VAEIETLFCGELEVNIDLLKQATIYEDISPTDRYARHIDNIISATKMLST
jgi:hypothetical protein